MLLENMWLVVPPKAEELKDYLIGVEDVAKTPELAWEKFAGSSFSLNIKKYKKDGFKAVKVTVTVSLKKEV